MANDRYSSFLQMMGLLQGAYSTAGQLKNTADSIAVNKYQAEQQARQFDVNADYTKEGRDYSRGLTNEAAKQSAEYKVAEDEAKRLYKDWGTVKKVLNPDGYTFTYSPAKMDEWEYKKIKEQGLSSGGYGKPKDNSTKLGTVIGAYTYMGQEVGWVPTESIQPKIPIKTEFSQSLKDLTISERNKYKNILPQIVKTTPSNQSWYDTTKEDEYANETYLDLYKQSDTRLGSIVPWVAGRVGYAGYQGIIKPGIIAVKTAEKISDESKNFWNYMMSPVGGK